jgi:hypothetical protein
MVWGSGGQCSFLTSLALTALAMAMCGLVFALATAWEAVVWPVSGLTWAWAGVCRVMWHAPGPSWTRDGLGLCCYGMSLTDARLCWTGLEMALTWTLLGLVCPGHGMDRARLVLDWIGHVLAWA